MLSAMRNFLLSFMKQKNILVWRMSGAAVLPPPALTAAALFPMYLPIPASTTWDDVPRRASMISVPLSAPQMQSQVTLSSLPGLTTADVLSAMSASMSATGK